MKRKYLLVFSLVCGLAALSSCTVNIYQFHDREGRLDSQTVETAPTAADREILEIQKQTCKDMRAIATAVESFKVDYGHYPTAGSITELKKHVEPTYIKRLPTKDGWGNRYIFQSTGDFYELRSKGSDGRNTRSPMAGPYDDPKFDILLINLRFVEFPRGAFE